MAPKVSIRAVATNVGRGAVCAAAITLALGPVPAVAGVRTESVQTLNSELVGGYRVASGDKLNITVFDEPSLSGQYTIGVSGDLALPLLDAIPASGKTTADLSQVIQDRLKQGGYVLTPRVSVEIVEHRPFYILGEVKQPGEYPYTGDLTFDQAVAKAGGFTARANQRVIYLKRQNSPAKVRVKIGETPLKIAPGDTITVREAFF